MKLEKENVNIRKNKTWEKKKRTREIKEENERKKRTWEREIEGKKGSGVTWGDLNISQGYSYDNTLRENFIIQDITIEC